MLWYLDFGETFKYSAGLFCDFFTEKCGRNFYRSFVFRSFFSDNFSFLSQNFVVFWRCLQYHSFFPCRIIKHGMICFTGTFSVSNICKLWSKIPYVIFMESDNSTWTYWLLKIETFRGFYLFVLVKMHHI